jgi:hypothetical protein
LQAAALHGALRPGGTPQPPGYLAALRDVELHAVRLDDPELGLLGVEARMEECQSVGLIYALSLHSAHGRLLVCGRGTIALPHRRDEV